jgi:hypothetical protein
VQQRPYIVIAGRQTSPQGWGADHRIDYKEMQMENYDYDEIEAYIAKARRLRSEAIGEYMARAWQALKNALKPAGKPKAKDSGRHGSCLPA